MLNAQLLLVMASEVSVQNITHDMKLICLEVFEKATLLALKKTKTKKSSGCGLI